MTRDEAALARIIIREAFFAGWAASGEGYNGEYPGRPPEGYPDLVEAAEELVRRFDRSTAIE